MGFFMTVVKVIKSLTRREDKAEERKKLKGGTEERQKAEEVRCCYSAWQIAQERGLCLSCVSRWEGKGKRSTSQGDQEISEDVVCRQAPRFFDKMCLFPGSDSFLQQIFCT